LNVYDAVPAMDGDALSGFSGQRHEGTGEG